MVKRVRARRPKKRRKRAADYGDNPRIRRKYGEADRVSDQPWEQEYQRRKRRLARKLKL